VSHLDVIQAVCNLHYVQVVHGQKHETIQFRGQVVKGQDHTRTRLYWKAWRRHRSWVLWVE